MSLTRRNLFKLAVASVSVAALPAPKPDPAPARVVVDPGWDGGTILITHPEDWVVHDYSEMFAFSPAGRGFQYYNYPQVFR